ncbi:uncharacterized protein ColSpa_09730 [Colletotrichum spaethianum]|uniref:FAD-dependent oxidoreductase 2 FAD-binding domain-containing protein n=1 Tax=Colletotrichum spaethianum TaxID=700344 RepID=A0AA37PCA3_9PEZI|nr:uncharacterized protein ColSpa_09730 [Colletotrichum spaethianum]GKT49549.1 hypothetical protein ColSpa_09730 [Colletotrichum spaethianum]
MAVLRPITALTALLLLPFTTLAQNATSNRTYDYIVIGSGPGGGPLACNLAHAGHSTLLIEAGDDQSSDIRTIIANGGYVVTPTNG